MKSRSLTRQILSIVLVAQVLCAVLLAIAAVVREADTHLRTFDERVQGRSDSLLGAIQDAEDADATVQVEPEELRLPGDDVYAVYNQGGRLLGSSTDAPPELTTPRANGFRTVLFHGVRYRVLQRQALRVIDRAEFGKEGLQRPVTIIYASAETGVWHQVFNAASFSLLAILTAAAVTMVSVAFFLRRALQPLSDLALAAGQISPPLLDFDPPASVRQIRELRPLANVLGQAVIRLREAFAKEQRFVGDAAHELKTAVAVVRSSVQLLMLKRRTQDEYIAGLERVLEDNIRVESLVAQMLLLSRLEEAPDPTAAPQDLCETLKKVLVQLKPVAEEQRLTFDFDSAPEMMVRISSERAEVLMSNILLNAIQNSKPSTAVEVRLTRRGAAAIAFEVRDWGAGIGEEALPHIFERFYREDGSRSRHTGGTGLGLAICKSIADQAGATILVTSQDRKGTKVTVVFGGA